MINVTAEFIFDATQRFPYGHPMNAIGCAVIADLSVALAYPEPQFNPLGRVEAQRHAGSITNRISSDPYNRTGRFALRK